MDWAVVLDNRAALFSAFLTTLGLAGATIVLSVLLAFPLALMREARSRPPRLAAAVFSWVMRAVPALTLLFLTYFGLPQIGIYLDAIPAAIAGLTLSAAGYNMEYIRAGLRAVPAEQYEAARSLGMGRGLLLRRVIVPQALRTIMPPLTSNLTLLMKGSSLAGMVAVTELTGEGMALISRTYRPFEILITIGITYLLMNGVLIWAQHRIEERFSLRRPSA